ncbi:glycosyltransferase family 4 protein [Candidatus Saccharibacteria bacterium]|nr:glycosyltransferase family 4 protein [Candidatus Saccharibacteria bacterium]
MKIGLVLDDSLDKSDGVQQYVLTLGRWYHQQGHEVHYLVGETHRRDIPRVHSLSRNVQVHFNQNRMSTPLPANRKRIKALLETEKFDVLHVQMPYSPFMAGRVIRSAPLQTALVGTFHIIAFSWTERWATRLLRLWLWRSRRRFDTVVSVSEPSRRFARQGFSVKSSVLPNVVNRTAFHNGKRITKFDDGKINLVFLGRLVPRKGCRQLLEALEIMHEQQLLSGLRVLICGKGPEEMALKQFVRSHRLNRYVHFMGFIAEADKPNYLATADLAVFPSLGGESFGIVLIEAMAARAGVVLGGNNSGYRSVLGERPHQLFDPLNSRQLAKTLKHFAFNTPERKRASAWQAEHITHYDVAKVGPRLIRLYEQAIAKRRPETDNTKHELSAQG